MHARLSDQSSLGQWLYSLIERYQQGCIRYRAVSGRDVLVPGHWYLISSLFFIFCSILFSLVVSPVFCIVYSVYSVSVVDVYRPLAGWRWRLTDIHIYSTTSHGNVYLLTPTLYYPLLFYTATLFYYSIQSSALCTISRNLNDASATWQRFSSGGPDPELGWCKGRQTKQVSIQALIQSWPDTVLTLPWSLVVVGVVVV